MYANIRDNIRGTNAQWNVIRGCREISRVSKNISDNLLNCDQDNDEDFKSQIYDIVRNDDSYFKNCGNNFPRELNYEITISEVENMCKDLNNNKSPGIGGLPYEFLKNSRHVITRRLSDLFNAIPTTGMYPDMWCAKLLSPHFI